MKFTKKALASKVNSVRPYKSRSKRPCDFCRRRKTCCIIEKSIPCLACVQFNKGNCTFVAGPLKRSRKSDSKRMSLAHQQQQQVEDEHQHLQQQPHSHSHSQPQQNTQSIDDTPLLAGYSLNMDYQMNQSYASVHSMPKVPAHPVQGTFLHDSYQSPHLISNNTSLPQLSPHTPAYSFQSNWSSGESASGTSVVVSNAVMPPELRQLMLSNSSLLSNMSTVSALSMGATYPYSGYDNVDQSGGFHGYSGLALWTDASDYDLFVTMELMPEELKRDYLCLLQAPSSNANTGGTLMAPVQALGFDGHSMENGEFGFGDGLVGPGME